MDRERRRLLHAGAALAMTLAHAGGRAADAAKREGFALGRFFLDLPAGARLRGRSQTIDHLSLTARDRAPGETLRTILSQARSRRRAQADGAAADVREPLELRHDMGAIIHRDDPHTPESIWMECVRVAGGTVFTLAGGNTSDRADAMLAAAARIGAAIVATRALLPDEPGFCVDGGVVRMDMSWEESAEATFMLPEEGTLAVRTHSNADHVGQPLLARLGSVRRMLDAAGVDYRAVRARPRTAAALEGDELVLHAPRSAVMLWEYRGRRRSGTHPRVTLRVDMAHPVGLGSLLPRWDALLDSFQARAG